MVRILNWSSIAHFSPGRPLVLVKPTLVRVREGGLSAEITKFSIDTYIAGILAPEEERSQNLWIRRRAKKRKKGILPEKILEYMKNKLDKSLIAKL